MGVDVGADVGAGQGVRGVGGGVGGAGAGTTKSLPSQVATFSPHFVCVVTVPLGQHVAKHFSSGP